MLGRRRFLSYTSATFGTSLLLKACGHNHTPKLTMDGESLKIAIAVSGLINNGAWNQSAYEGLQLTKQKLGAQITYVEQLTPENQAQALSDLARKGYNLIFAHGEQFEPAISQVAPQFSQTFFVAVNGTIKGENIAALQIDHLQASYLCGIIGASMSKSNTLAYLAAQKLPTTEQELRGLELGAKRVKPSIEIQSSFIDDGNDVAKAKKATLALIASGADVIYQWLDSASDAVLQTASEKKVYAFGNVKDQLEVAPQAVLTSAVKRIDLAIAQMASLAKKKQLKGQIYIFGLEKPDILYLGKFATVVPELVQQEALSTKEDIVAKKITFENCKEGGKNTRCVKSV